MLISWMALFLCCSMCVQRISMALGNCFFGLALIIFLYNCWLQKFSLPRLFKERIGNNFLKVYGVFLVCFLPSVIFSDMPGFSLKQFFEMFIYRALPFFMLALFVEKKELLDKLLFIFLGVEALDSLVSVWQVYGSPSFQPFKAPHAGYRGIGFGGQVLNLAALLASLIPVTALIILDNSFSKRLKQVAYIALPCMLLGAVIGIKSRALWLLIIALAPFVLYKYAKESKKVLCVSLVLFLLGGTFFVSNPRYMRRLKSSVNMTTDVSNRDRLWLWKSSLNMMKDYPLTGVGLGNFRRYYRAKYQLHQIKQKKLSHAHNNWMHLGADAGIPGLLGYSFLTAWVVLGCFWQWLKTKNVYDLMLFCAWAGFSGYGLIDLTADASISVKLICFLSGIILCYKHLDHQKE